MVLPRRRSLIEIKADCFTDRIVLMYKYLVNGNIETIMAKQVYRSGTSIGANITESQNAQSDADFVSKLSIALKEADETLYWLKKLYTGGYLTNKQFNSMETDNIEIIKILTSIIKTKKKNMGII